MLALWRRAEPAVGRWIAVSGTLAHQVRRELAIPAERMTVVPSGIDTACFRPDASARRAMRARLGLPVAVPVVLTTSRLEREKGLHVLLDALTLVRVRHPDVTLLVAGRGHDAERLKRRAETTELAGSVVFLGLLERAELPAVYAAADVFALPTLCDEALPVSLVEAQASGLPAVASAVGGTGEAVADGVTGVLVPRGDRRAVAHVLERLLAAPDLRRSMGEAARRRAVERFGEEGTARATERVLLEAVNESG
jgi:phosphatidylinositol alpha-1,6-mannosyltransferase